MHNFEFKAGQVIEIEYRKSISEAYQFRTLIEISHGNTEFLILAPMYQATVYPFQENDEMDIIFMILDDENRMQVFGFRAKIIEKVRRENISYLRIVRVSGFKKKQRRNFYRLSYVAEMLLNVIKDSDEEPIPVTILTRDISAGGIRGIVSKHISAGSKVSFFMDLGNEVIEIPGVVVGAKRVEDSILKNEIRIEYTGMGRKETAKVIQYINTLQTEYIKRMSAASLEERLARYGHEEPAFLERRLKKDWIMLWLDGSVVLSWLLIFVIVINFLLARPEKANTIQYYYGFPVRLNWDYNILQINRYIIIVLLIMSSLSLRLNSLRMKREGDRYRTSLIIASVIAIILLIIYLILI